MDSTDMKFVEEIITWAWLVLLFTFTVLGVGIGLGWQLRDEHEELKQNESKQSNS